MVVRTRVEPLDRDIQLILSQELGPQAHSATIAKLAREALQEGQDKNRRALGRTPPHKTFVDGSEGKQVEQVRPDGRIVYEFELIGEALTWIGEQLRIHSPVGGPPAPAYQQSHRLFADGSEIAIGVVPPSAATEFVFVSTLKYSRKIEGVGARAPLSPQAPNGVYEAVAGLANKKYGRMAKIAFSYRGVVGERYPAIVVTLR